MSDDKRIGLNEPIDRRDFLNGALLGVGSVLMGGMSPVRAFADSASDRASDDFASEWDGYGGIGDYANAHGNSWRVLQAAHGVRDSTYDSLLSSVVTLDETYDCVVVGGGISGLSAAFYFHQQGGSGRTCLILENHAMFGGEARRNEFLIDGQRLLAPQGAVQFPIPFSGGLLDRFYRAVGFNYWEFEYQTWEGTSPPMQLGRTVYAQEGTLPPTFGFYFGKEFGQDPGKWIVDPVGTKFAGAPVPEALRAEMRKVWRRSERTGISYPFKYLGDEFCRRLDGMTLEEHFVQDSGISREFVRRFMSPAAGVGVSADAISAFSFYSYLPAKDFTYQTGLNMSPGGLAGLARHVVKTLIPDCMEGQNTLGDVCRSQVKFETLDRPENPVRLRLESTVAYVQHEGDPEHSEFVSIVYARGGKLYRIKARSVVMAGGGWITRHVVRDLPPTHREAYNQFYYGSYLRANVAVRNWKFLYKLGLSGGKWFEGFGGWTEVRKVATFGAPSKTIGPDSPTVLTIDQGFTYPGLSAREQGTKGRMTLLSTSFSDYERQIRETLTNMFSQSGFDARRDIAGIILNRWGHAFNAPQPGFFFGKDGKPAPRDVLRSAPFGRIAFAHADLAGAQDHASSIREAHRAVEQLLEVAR